jgi:hypothetical protein
MPITVKRIFPKFYKYGGQEVQVRHLEAWITEIMSQVDNGLYALASDLAVTQAEVDAAELAIAAVETAIDTLQTLDLTTSSFTNGVLVLGKSSPSGATSSLQIPIRSLYHTYTSSSYADIAANGNFTVYHSGQGMISTQAGIVQVNTTSGLLNSTTRWNTSQWKSWCWDSVTHQTAAKLNSTEATFGYETALGINGVLQTGIKVAATYLDFIMAAGVPMRLNGTPGTAGQYLKTNGAGAPATWGTIVDKQSVTLVAGTATLAYVAATANTRVVPVLKTLNASTAIAQQYQVTVNAGVSIVITAINAVAATEVNDLATLELNIFE